jgi:hypothetical protein
MTFFVTGDEWALVDIVPRENLSQFERARAEYAEHHKDTTFGPYGWTTPPFLLPAPHTPLAVRAIPLSRLADLFSGALSRADLVETCVDFTGPPYEAKGCYAWAEPPNCRAGIYGDTADGIVQSMYLADVSFGAETANTVAERLAQLAS